MALTIDNREVVQARELYARAPKQMQKDMRAAVNREVNPWLRYRIRGNARTAIDKKLADTARIRAGRNPAVVVGGGKRFSGGAQARQLAGAYEFGSRAPEAYERYGRRSPKGQRHNVYRRTKTQLPVYSKSGRFIMAAVAEAAPRTVRLWVKAIIEAYTGDRIVVR